MLLVLGCGGLVACGNSSAEASRTRADDPYEEVLELYYEAGQLRQTDREAFRQLMDEAAPPYNTLPWSIIHPYWADDSSKDLLSGIGYARQDLNGDGLDELLLGWIGNELWNLEEGYVFAVYTILDGEPTLAVEGWERCRYVLCEDGTLCCERSDGAFEGSCIRYRFPEARNSPNPDGGSLSLEPVEAIWHGWNEEAQSNCYVYSSDPAEIQDSPSPAKYSEWMDLDDAERQIEGWMNAGMRIHAIPLAEYQTEAERK